MTQFSKSKSIKLLNSRYEDPLLQQAFTSMLDRFMSGDNGQVNWSNVIPLAPEELPGLDALDDRLTELGTSRLRELAVLKLNGGLGTSMGCRGPKSLITIYKGQHFLELVQQQLAHARDQYGQSLPLILMNSDTTHEPSMAALDDDAVMSFMQHQFPRLEADTLLPVESPGSLTWYPPGHGNLYLAFVLSGLCDQLLEQGIRTVMVSNSDNLGATVDPKILGYMVDRELDFLMEATPKTRLDVKGGGPVRIDGQLTLLEQGQIPSEHVPEFQNIERYTVFNTNTLWINVAAIKANLEKLITQLPLIVNPKTFDGHKTIQLETAMGAALGVFDRAGLVVVSRDRFIPVKQTSDLMLIRSDAVDVYDDCFFRYAPEFKAHDFAKISLGDAFKTVDHFEQRVKVIPSLKAVTSLRIDGDVTIATAQSFAGDQVITAEPGNSLTL